LYTLGFGAFVSDSGSLSARWVAGSVWKYRVEC
jgi:hypothetical protein